MYQEPLFFIEPEKGESESRLIFAPLEVISITSASSEVQFEEGRDYRLILSGPSKLATIKRPEGSRIPTTKPTELKKLWNTSKEAFSNRTAVITYRHKGRWAGFTPVPVGIRLLRTMQKLARKEPLTISLAGDSICEGHNASGFMKMPPHQPAFGPLVAKGLEYAYGSPISFHNFGAEGWTTDHGLYIDGVVTPRPDLVIIGYGMNDLGHAEANSISANIQRIIDKLRNRLPDAELILISPMLANPEWDYPVHERFPQYRDALVKLCGEGVALADMTSLWMDLLLCKNYYELTGNGLNHPNDFGHRAYAQVILELLSTGQACNPDAAS